MEDAQPTYWSIYYKNYYDDNKEKIKERMKEWKQDNKDKLKVYRHNYYEKNKEKLLEKINKKTYCEICDKEVSHFTRHITSKKHIKNADNQ